jgi:Zn2+/Cd2+-exporting ATPase
MERSYMLTQISIKCVTCVRAVGSFSRRYRSFLLDPGTLFTAASLILLISAILFHPSGLFGSDPDETRSPLYLIAAMVGSSYIWWSAVQGIRARDFTADIPVSLATLAAIAIGQYSAAAVVAALLLLGGLLENFVSARAGRALEALAKLLPKEVMVRRNGVDIRTPLEDVKIGDLVLVRLGERVPVDGLVISGKTVINQAAITGESMPVFKQTGDTVFAGTLVEEGVVEIRALKIGDETILGQIRRMVEEAQKQKAPIERLLDHYAKFYTPVAILLGTVLWLVSHDPLRAITILIVFCPCVMVLATPTAMVASIGNAALRGSLVKKGATIEALAKIDTIAFDKTGTLTSGKPHLVDVIALESVAESNLLKMAASAEKFSEHPLGQAVVQAAAARGLPVTDPKDFQAMTSLGVMAQVEGHEVLLGRAQRLSEQSIPVTALIQDQTDRLSRAGRTVISIAVDRKMVGMITLEDSIRPEAKKTVERLQALGLRTILISGDNQATAERIAAETGIREVYAEVLPQQKVEIVRRLQAEGRKVAIVGDGVNDGPALAAADVGIAMGLGGTDVAIETAEIALLSDDLSNLPHLLSLSRKAIRAVYQNLAFSLGVLVVAVTLTVVGVLRPVSGALLHELSSLPVIANSVRLIGIKE